MLLLDVVSEGKSPRIRSSAQPAYVLQVVFSLVRLHVRPDGVQRGKRPVALVAGERLDVAVLVSGQLDPGLEGLRAVRTFVGSNVRMRQQMVIVYAVRLKSLVAVRALVRTCARMRAHVEGEAITDAERLPADLAHVGFLPSVDAFVFHFFVRSGEASAAVLAFVAPLLTLVQYVFLHGFIGDEALLAVGAGEFFAVAVGPHVHF